MGHHVERDSEKARPSRRTKHATKNSFLSATLSTCNSATILARMEDTTMMEAQGGSQPLFEGLVFTIIPNSLTEQRVEEVTERVQSDRLPD